MLRKLETFIIITFFILAMSTLASAQDLDAFKGKTGNIEIAGGTAHIPVMKEAAKRIMTTNPAIRITVAGGGSGVGVQKAGEGLVDIGNTGRAVTEAEKSKYGLVSFPFAIDGVAVVVHKANPLHGLTQAQVKDIFAGKITNWKQLGGPNAAIDVYTRDEASGTREVFWEKMLSKGAIIDSANVVASNGAMKTAVAGDKNAIGYVSIGHIDDTLKAPLLDGVEPSQETAVSGAYKVTRLLYMNTKGEPQGLVKSFIEYVRGPEGAEITKASGYIPTK
ncbi:phosphate ABC transporter substrate-binding protein [Desulfocurvibacter africanus]|uniref:phosphate ABC transporter substrate-binding protein n=1 Tax=Desulfocurvibacter africanus TaxID=873 RepID=UPI002FDA21E9